MAKKEDLKKKKVKHARLAWQILACKFLYYEGPKHNIPTSMIPDDNIYDKWEEEYKKLCKELKTPTTVTDMVGFSDAKGSAKMVKEAMIYNKGNFKMDLKDLKSSNNPIQKTRKKVNVYNNELKEVLEEIGLKEKTAKKILIRMKKRFKL